MQTIKNTVKQLVKEEWLAPYYFLKAWFWALYYRMPAKDMVIVGVTGTKGKTSTSNYVWSVATAGGFLSGILTTANFRIGPKNEVNAFHMTMPSARFIQKKLREMKEAGVKIAVVEMTSEGMKQFRHIGIPVDIAIFTNLTPEHLGSHKNNFDLYKKAKSPLFKALKQKNTKSFVGMQVPRTIIANADSVHSDYYLSFPAEKKITYGITQGDIRATAIIEEVTGTRFVVQGQKMRLSIPGQFNIYNALPACIVGTILQMPIEKIREGMESLGVIPGRMERITEGQPFTVIVDYAHEPASMTALLDSARSIKQSSGKIILLTGVIGGGRASRIPLIEVASSKADILIITNEDPYDDDPEYMIDKLVEKAVACGKTKGTTVLPIIDRKKAIATALSLATPADIVLISGKGAETTMMVKGGAVPFDEREITKELARTYAK